ncbi:MAG: RNA polymerase subunit sigma-70 [Bacteroidetes bacterium 4572_77]|nr:MAG: RNA polymerase subunit sigma-70 [Bacteroidetes bacterium 4572_77]
MPNLINNTSDTTLIALIKDGDSSAFRQLVDRYKDVSLSLAFSILKDSDIAEDALQESFLKVYKNIHKFRAKASFATWLYRIVVNTSIKEAMKMLKSDEALLLQLYYLSELSVKEIMLVTKFKRSKVKVTLHRGRENLRLVLGNILGEEIELLL